jgi:hypothetical protein
VAVGIPSRNSQSYSHALEDVIAAGDQLVNWLPQTREKGEFALGKLVRAVDSLVGVQNGIPIIWTLRQSVDRASPNPPSTDSLSAPVDG